MVFDVIRTKRAVRQFTDQQVPEEIILTIVDAGRLAQSSKNDQPWHFIVVRDREKLRQLATFGKYAGHLGGANFGVALVVEPGYDFDLGQAAAYMQLVAWEHGVASCLASLWEPDQAKTLLGVPAAKQLKMALSFGYPLEKPASTKAGGRRAINDVIRWEQWQ